MRCDFKLIRSARKTISLEITADAEVVVRAPQRMPYDEVCSFVEAHSGWLHTHLPAAQERFRKRESADAEQLKLRAECLIPQRVEYWSRIMNLTPSGVRITAAKTRFGSCSPANSLCFSYYLMQFPDAAIDYVIVHELAHIREKNHGKAFYRLIERYLPDYRERIKLLK